MYKILIKYSSNIKPNLWEVYGSTVTSASKTTTFTEFDTDDIELLKEELLELDKIYGHENLKVIKEIDTSYSVNVDDENAADDDQDTDSADSADVEDGNDENSGGSSGDEE